MVAAPDPAGFSTAAAAPPARVLWKVSRRDGARRYTDARRRRWIPHALESAANRTSVDSFAGRVAERLKAPVLKTGNGQPFVGSNPTSSARQSMKAPGWAPSSFPASRARWPALTASPRIGEAAISRSLSCRGAPLACRDAPASGRDAPASGRGDPGSCRQTRDPPALKASGRQSCRGARHHGEAVRFACALLVYRRVGPRSMLRTQRRPPPPRAPTTRTARPRRHRPAVGSGQWGTAAAGNVQPQCCRGCGCARVSVAQRAMRLPAVFCRQGVCGHRSQVGWTRCCVA